MYKATTQNPQHNNIGNIGGYENKSNISNIVI